jgi:hypothetical protein
MSIMSQSAAVAAGKRPSSRGSGRRRGEAAVVAGKRGKPGITPGGEEIRENNPHGVVRQWP